MESDIPGKIVEINGPVIKGSGLKKAFIGEQLLVGKEKLPGEVIRASTDSALIQVYEDTQGLTIGEDLFLTGTPLSVELGPGLVGSIFDGLQRPLNLMAQKNHYIERGSTASALDTKTRWRFVPAVKNGDIVEALDIIGTVQETEAFTHRIMLPHAAGGTVTFIAEKNELVVLFENFKKTNQDAVYILLNDLIQKKTDNNK